VDQLQAFYTEMVSMQNSNLLRTAGATRHAFHADKNEWKRFADALDGEGVDDGRRLSPYLTMAPQKGMRGVDVSKWEDLE